MTSKNLDNTVKSTEKAATKGQSGTTHDGCLGFSNNGYRRIGFVEEVDGPSSEIVPDWPVTRHELLQLVKYWHKSALDNDYFMWRYGEWGSDWAALRCYGWRRVDQFEAVLGPEAVKKACEEVTAEFAADEDPEVWNLYVEGKAAPLIEEWLSPEELALRERPPWFIDNPEEILQAVPPEVYFSHAARTYADHLVFGRGALLGSLEGGDPPRRELSLNEYRDLVKQDAISMDYSQC
jgi:hypothetical protein